MSDDRSIRVRLLAEIGQYRDGLRQAAMSTKDFGREVSGMGKTSKADLEKVGRGALLMAGGLAVGFGLAAKAAIDWESAWAGVTKTVDGSAAQMADLEEGLRDLASELPATHAEIAAVAEAAGALGIQRDAIEGFTKTMIDLGETTDLTADQAATSMARIANVMQTPQTEFDRMGSTLVDLGNKGASTESEILELAQRLSAAGSIAGLTEADVLSMASALSSVGVEAEAGGTAMSKVFTTVSDAVIDGSEKLDTFARVAGVTSEQFAASFREDPAMAINDFVVGLGRMIDSGQSLTPVFEELELTDMRLMNALKSTAGAGDILTKSIETGRAAWEANNALQTEAEKRYSTTAAQMEMARNNITDLAINVGGVLLPALAAGADGASKMAQGFSEMPGPLQAVTLGIGGTALAGLGMVAAAALLIPKIAAIRTSLIAMGAAGKVAAASMPWLAAAAAAIGVVSFAFGDHAQEAEEAEDRVKGYTDAIREAGDAADGTRSHVEELVADSAGLAHLLDDAGMSATDLGTALGGTDAQWDKMRSKLIATAEAAGISGLALEGLKAGLDGQRDAAQQGAENAETLGRVIGDAGDAASGAGPKIGSLAGDLGLSADEAKRAHDEFEDLLDAYRASVDPLFGMLDALEANRDAMGAEAEARAEGAREIADATEVVRDAEKDLRAARGKKDNLEGIAAAEERLADARERLTETQADAVISAEDLAAMNQAVAESALDVDVAARQLGAAIAEGTVSVEQATAMLQGWVDKGLITEGQAMNMASQFEIAAEKADLLAGDYVANFFSNTEPAIAKLDELAKKIEETFKVGAEGAPLSINQVEHLLTPRAGGGDLKPGVPYLFGEDGPEVGVFGTSGQMFSNDQSKELVGSMFRGGGGGSLATAGAGGGTSYDYSRHTSWSPSFTLVTPDPTDAAGSVEFRMRRLALELDG